MRVLVTGASGFVGRHLSVYCASRSATVTGVGRYRTATPQGVSAYRALDLCDAGATRALVSETRPERVIHLAAAASVAASWREPGAILDTNLHSTLSLLEAVRQAVPEARVLVVGSGEIYGPPAELPVEETAPLRPQNPYAVSKASADLLAGFYADAYDLSVVRTRAFNHSGPGQSDAYVVSAFARQIAAAEAAGERSVTLRTGSLEPRRDFTDVRDVVRAYWALLDGAPAGAYNVCSGEATAVRDILAGLTEHTELEVEQVTDPGRVREHEVMEIRGSNEKLTQATGWRPEIPLARTLADTLDWWRDRVRA